MGGIPGIGMSVTAKMADLAMQNITLENVAGASAIRPFLVAMSIGGSCMPMVAAALPTNDTPGVFESTGRDLDVGVVGGNGFIPFEGPPPIYCSTASLTLKPDGSLVGSTGLCMMASKINPGTGEMIDFDYSPETLEPVKISNDLSVKATQELKFSFNMPANAAQGTTQKIGISLVDGLGVRHRGTMTFQSTNQALEWKLTDFQMPGATLRDWGNGNSNDDWKDMVLKFNNQGRADTFTTANANVNNGAPPSLKITWANGAQDSDVQIDCGGMSCFGTQFVPGDAYDNGREASSLVRCSLEEGKVVAHYSNGDSIPLYQVVLAKFPNPNNMEGRQGGWIVTQGSGEPILGASGTPGFGDIQGGGLLNSNIDIRKEVEDLSNASQLFSANSFGFQTSVRMFQDFLSRVS